MRAGNREAAAAFLTLYKPLIMRRFRCKINADVARVWDLDDLFATVSRRLDRMVLEGKLTAASPAQLVDLILTIGEHALIDQQRRLPTAAAQMMAAQANPSLTDGRFEELLPPHAIRSALDGIDSPNDQDLFRFWLMGQPLWRIALQFGCRSAAIRKRLQRMRQRLISDRWAR